MRIGRLKFRKPWRWLPDCAICKIPSCGSRWFSGGTYDCPRRKVWNKTHDKELATKAYWGGHI